jgi:tellurite resistance protein
MSENAHAPFTPEEWETLLKAPVLVFLLVAAMDGKVDEKEVKGFQKILREAATYKSELLRNILIATMDKIPAILAQILSSSGDAGRTLQQVKAIAEAKLPVEEAKLFKQSLLYVGKQIAESSGGFLGFGSKISKEEKAALNAVALLLGVTE